MTKTGVTVLVCLVMAPLAAAQTFKVLLSFGKLDGAVPQAGLIQGTDGNLYGTTTDGGTSDNCVYRCGTIFRVTPTGSLTSLYSFCEQSSCPDGSNPSAGLVQAGEGDFYGTTAFGGSSPNCDSGCGTVFKFTRDGMLTTLHSFDLADGYLPIAPLIQDSDGNLYGTTVYGGQGTCNAGGGFTGCGTVFRITPSGTLTTLHSFDGSDGSFPYSALLETADGDFYGQTSTGSGGGGTAFKMTPEGKLTTLNYFGSYGPDGALIQGLDRNFYGTTYGGGGNTNAGTVFKMTPTGVVTTLHSFDGEDGQNPNTGLLQATDGNFYGTTFIGGMRYALDGTIFEITPQGAFTTLHEFCSVGYKCADGFEPELAPLIQHTNGIIYGAIDQGGSRESFNQFDAYGTIVTIDMGLGQFVAFVRPFGKVGQSGGILGQGFTGTTSVSLNGTPASFTVVSDTYIRGTVPVGGTTGYVTVTTPSGVLTSNVPFHVIP
jgi:uncharacterized repeat protein (TIGR03803 family)